MSYTLVIRRASDGAVRRHTESREWDSGPEGVDSFYWFDGNGACDCERGRVFAESAGEPNPQSPCGGNAYVIDRVELPDGTTRQGDN